jgi:hypothetical protein
MITSRTRLRLQELRSHVSRRDREILLDAEFADGEATHVVYGLVVNARILRSASRKTLPTVPVFAGVVSRPIAITREASNG